MNLTWSLILFVVLLLILIKNLVLAWSLPFLGVMFGLPITQFIPSSNYFIYSLQITGIVASIKLFTLSQNNKMKKRLMTSVLFLSYVSLIGILTGLNEVSFIVALQGVKLLFLPILLSLGAIYDGISWERIYKSLVTILSVQILVAICEYFIGVSKLLELGLVYGTQIRQIEGQLRAPALFATHFEFGLYSAAVFSISYYANLLKLKITTIWIQSAIVIGLLGVILSTARTAFLIVITVFMFKRIESSDIPKKVFKRFTNLIAIALVSVLILIFVPSVFTLASLHSRFANWGNILGSFNTLFGKGVGVAGGATISNFADLSNRLVVDNYILSLFVQFGIVGLVLFLISLRNYSYLHPKLDPILVSILVSFLTLETWEYYGAISLMLILQVRLSVNTKN